MRKVRLKGVRYVAQGHRRSSWYWNTKESSLCWREMRRSACVRHRVSSQYSYYYPISFNHHIHTMRYALLLLPFYR